MIKQLTRYSTSYPKTTILIIALLTAHFFIYLPNLQQEEDPWAIIPSQHPVKNYYYEIKEIIDVEKGPEKIYLGGTPVLWVEENILSNEGFSLLVPIVIMVIVLLLFLSFRNFQGVYVPLCVVFMSVVWSLGCMSILNVKLSIVGNTIAVILIAIGTADAIHILAHYYDQLKKGINKIEALNNTMNRLAMPIVMTSITTMVGFCSLVTSKIPMIREFGVFTAIGIFSAMIFSLTLIPAVLSLSKGPPYRKTSVLITTRPTRSIFINWGKIIEKRKWLAIALIIIIIGFAGHSTSRTIIEYSPKTFYKKSNDVRKAQDFFEENFAGATELDLILRTNEDDSFKKPGILKKLNELQEKIESNNHVGKVVSVVDYVKRMNYVMHDEDLQYNRLPQTIEPVKT